MSILQSLQTAIKEAMLSKDKTTLHTLRMLSAAFKQIEIDKKISLDDAVLQEELVRQVKQRKDSANQFRKADRVDLAEIEEAEILIIQRFLPEQLSYESMTACVDQLIQESGIELNPSAMGKLMGLLKPELSGKADMADVSKYIRKKIQEV